MAEPIRIHCMRYHVQSIRGGQVHEWKVTVTRGSEQLSEPPAFGKDLAECVRRAVGRARKALRKQREAARG